MAPLAMLAAAPLLADFRFGDEVGPGVALAALILGATSSLHCFLMCGPLACSAIGSVDVPVAHLVRADAALRRRAALRAAAGYHLARVVGYAVAGGVLGAFGGALSRALPFSIKPALPWLMAATLLASALDLGKHLARRVAPIPGLSQILRRATQLAARFSQSARAIVMGGITPLLPCGLLYAAFASATATSTFADGATLMAAFGLGAIPALLAAQVQTRFAERLPLRAAQIVRRAIPAVAAVVLVYRAVLVGSGQACH